MQNYLALASRKGKQFLGVDRLRLSLTLLCAIMLCSACASATREQRERVLRAAETINADVNQKQKVLPPSKPERKPIRAGQWVSFFVESRDRSEDLVLRTIRIISASRERTHIELESLRALDDAVPQIEGYWIKDFPLDPVFEPTYRQMQVALNRLKFEKVVSQRGSEEPEPWPDTLLLFSATWLEKLFITGHSLDPKEPRMESCNNGTFLSDRCYVQRFALTYLEHDSAGRAFLHSEVPIVGFLQAVDERYVYRVIGFGDTGAEQKLAM